ncbi:MAG: serine/threonine protein kinase [Planctomycetes bacterium]|nr:serine/threonine protein kinase [Planctomycetota bacterium]
MATTAPNPSDPYPTAPTGAQSETVRVATSGGATGAGLRKLGSFRILGPLGNGGMGVVYKAHDETLDRVVAVKVLSGQLGADDEFRERFLREARAAAGLDHPNIVPIYSAGDQDGILYIAMQYVQGETLTTLVRRKDRLSVRRALEITRDASLALAEAHRRGFIHRDIKCSNIMVDADGRVKVMDFGLSRGMRPGQGITQSGTYLGTPEYSSPEQCETHDLDGRTDLYSLGVCLYEMLTGRLPHTAQTPVALFRKIVDDRPVPVAEINPNLSRPVARFVDRLLAKRRDDRPATADAAAEEAQTLLTQERLPATAEDEMPLRVSATAVTLAAAPACARRPWYSHVVGATAGLLVFLTGAGYWFSRTTDPAPVATTPTPGTPSPRPDGAPPARPPETGSLFDPAESVLKVAIIDFQNVARNPEFDWLGVGIPEMLLAAIEADPRFQVFAREDLVRELQRRNLCKDAAIGECAGEGKAEPGGEAKAGAEPRLTFSPAIEEILRLNKIRLLLSGSFTAPRGAKEIAVAARVTVCLAGGRLERLQVKSHRGPADDVFSLVDGLAAEVVSQIIARRDQDAGLLDVATAAAEESPRRTPLAGRAGKDGGRESKAGPGACDPGRLLQIAQRRQRGPRLDRDDPATEAGEADSAAPNAGAASAPAEGAGGGAAPGFAGIDESATAENSGRGNGPPAPAAPPAGYGQTAGDDAIASASGGADQDSGIAASSQSVAPADAEHLEQGRGAPAPSAEAQAAPPAAAGPGADFDTKEKARQQIAGGRLAKTAEALKKNRDAARPRDPRVVMPARWRLRTLLESSHEFDAQLRGEMEQLETELLGEGDLDVVRILARIGEIERDLHAATSK